MEEQTPILTDSQILAARRKYARDYQNKRYSNNKELGANKSSIAYHKRNSNLTNEDIDKYGIHSPNIIKVRIALDKIKETNPTIVKNYIKEYLESLE